MTRVGIEIGGTFTDLVAVGPRPTIAKVPSVRLAPEEGAFAALAASGVPIPSIAELVHGSTVATNAVLERKGARLAFLATEGFRDILLLQRHDRRRIFDLFYAKPEPLAARGDTLEVPERIGGDGRVQRALDVAAFAPSLLRFLRDGGHDAVAICLLNGFANPVHEAALAALLRAEIPGLPVTCSHEVTREFREYERATTTTVAAFVQPVIDRYLGGIETRLSGMGFAGSLSMMQSSGGRVPFAAVRRNAASALLSGPAAGVTGALRHAARAGFRDVVMLDIGGTSADVSLVRDGRPVLARGSKVDGLPVLLPMVDIVTIGAGGGSIVWRDDGDMLRVGPRSAGADPGPACYGRGGTEPTLSDAHVVCGRLPGDTRLAGRFALEPEAAARAFAPIAAALGSPLAEAAESAIRLAESNIVAAIRLVSTERGHDPREFALVPYGGAGPLHAAPIAAELGIGTVVVPPDPGVVSAYGLLAADHVLFETLTRRVRVDEAAADAVRDAAEVLRATLRARAAELGLPPDASWEFALDMRYAGQAYEIEVPLEMEALAGLDREELGRRFGAAHRRIYQHGSVSGKAVEIVSFRLALRVAQAEVPPIAVDAPADGAPPSAPARLFADGSWCAARRVARRAIAPGEGLDGPAIVVDATATTYVPDGWRATGGASGELVLRRTS